MFPDELRQPLTRAQARALGIDSAGVRRLMRAGAAVLLADGRVRVTPTDDDLSLARLGLGENVVLCLESAAVRYGWPVSAELLHLSLPRARSRVRWPGAEVRTCRHPGRTELVDGLLATSPETTIVDLACYRGLRPALRCLDVALRQRQTYSRRIRRELARRAQSPGIRVARVAVDLSCELRQSPLESDFRLLVHTAGLPAPVDQYAVRSRERVVARVDFAWPEAMLVVEIDGYEFHSDITPFNEDRRKERLMRLDGWLVLRYTAKDLEQTPELVIEQVRAALIDRGLLEVPPVGIQVG